VCSTHQCTGSGSPRRGPPDVGIAHHCLHFAPITRVGVQGTNKGYWVAKKKMSTSAEMLCRTANSVFREFTDSVINAKFEDEPNYSRYIAMFEPLTNVPERPLVVEAALRVGGRAGGVFRYPPQLPACVRVHALGPLTHRA
jgi:hypothetical protein